MNIQRMLLLVLMASTVCITSAGEGAADEVNLMFEGQLGGGTYAVAVSGNYAYVGQGESLIVVDISNLASPIQLGKVSTGHSLQDITVSGNYAYVANSANGLVVVDISDPTAPSLAGHYDTAGSARGVTVSGNYAYVADNYNGLVVIDISDPTAPSLAGHYDTVGSAYGVTVSGNYAYVADNYNGLVVVDISDPAAPSLAGHYDTAGSAYGVTVSDNYAYVADWTNGLVVVDISDPAAPSLAGHYDTTGRARDVTVSGNYAYVADSSHGLEVVEISDPAAPSLAVRYDTPNNAMDVTVSGNYAYVADYHGLVVVDISDLVYPFPLLAGHYDTTIVFAMEVTVSGNYAYVADSANGLVVVDISDPAAPSLAGHYDTAYGGYGVTVGGNYAYVVDPSQGLVVVDISDPAAPSLAGQYDTVGSVYGVTVSGNYAYVADSANGLVVVDISDPAAPSLAGHYDTTGWARDVTVSGNYAYVADSTNGLVVVDISDPAAPSLAGQYNTAGNAYGVTVSGNYAYVADKANGLVVVDISDPAAPSLAGYYIAPGGSNNAIEVTISGNYAYVADWTHGLLVVNISDPAALSLAGHYDTASDTHGVYEVTVSGNYAYVADSNNGLVILRTDVTLLPNILVGQGAPTPTIEQLFIDAYNRNDGVGVLGDPTTEVHDAWGYLVQDFPGANGYAGGIIMYNPNENSAYYIHGKIWDRYYSLGGPIAQTDIEFQLGLPISDVLPYVHSEPPLISTHGSQYRYQNFAGETEMAALEYNLAADMVYEIHGAIYATWSAMGYADSILGLISSDEREAAPSFKGTTGRVSDFENGHLHWHSSGDHYMVTYMTYGDLDELYVFMGGTASWLGFPVMHQEEKDGYGYCEFEGGYIEWDGSDYKAIPITGHVHNINKGTDYTTIQAAIHDASTGDEIHVDSGTYYENVFVNKQLILRGIDTGEGMPVVDADESGNVITLSEDGVVIEGFTVTNASFPEAGIEVNSNNNIIAGNIASNNRCTGIRLTHSSNNNNVTGNTASNNVYGIDLSHSNNNIITGNTANGNSYGIRHMFSGGNTLKNNFFSGNNINFELSGYSDSTFNNDIDTSNLVDGKPIYYLVGASGAIIDSSSDVGTVYCISCNNVIIKDLTLMKNGNGIHFYKTQNSRIQNNRLSDNVVGINLCYSSNNNNITGNIASNNSFGVVLNYFSNNNTIAHNIVSGTDSIHHNNGIVVHASNDNIIYQNNLDNDKNAIDYGTNQWDSGTIGNFYSDYTGTDSDDDGIGDTVYPIPGGSSEDRYPLMAPYSPTPPPTAPHDKTLLQIEGQPEVYWLQNARLYWVTDGDVISQMSGVPGWDSVNILPASEFDPADYEQGPKFITTGAESDGLLIRQLGDYKVYHTENGNKRHITYPDLMDLKGYSFDDVIEVSSEISNMFQVGEPIGIEVDLYFNKCIDSVETSHESQFTTDETVKLITETTVAEDYTVETYVKMIKPDGTEKYAYYENVDFLINDQLKFSDTERPLYPGTWHAQTKTWNWNEYVFSGNEMEGVYTWEFWYEDVTSGRVLGKDVQAYEFSKTPFSLEDTISPFIVITNSIDKTFDSYDKNVIISGTAYDQSDIFYLKVTVNGDTVFMSLGESTFYFAVTLKEGLNEIAISAIDNSENRNENTEILTVNYIPFSAQIPWPKTAYRYTSDEFTSLTGEVIEGIPPFTYKWTIGGDEYSETSDYRNIRYPIMNRLDSGRYTIQLEVTDANEYTVNAKAKQIIISPFNVDSNFKPNPNGYQFKNFARDDYSWFMFEYIYGEDQVEFSDGTQKETAKTFYEDHFRHAGRKGTCFGMSASSLITYTEDYNRNIYKSWDLGPDRDSTLPDWPFFPLLVFTPTDWAEYYQPLQFSVSSIADRYFIYNNPIDVYDELKLRMASGTWMHNPMVIGGAGHAVVPYKIEETADHRIGNVFIYDSEIPNSINPHIEFNLADGTAKTCDGNDCKDWSNGAAVSLFSIQETPLMWSDLDTVNPWGHLLYEDSIGRQYGYNNGEFKEDIPGVALIIPWGQTEDDQFPETYYIPDVNLKRKLIGVENGIATVSVLRPNNLVIADVQVSPSSVDELRVPADGSNVEFISGDGTPSLSLMIVKENTDFGRFVCISSSDIESGGGGKLFLSDDLTKIGIINKGLLHGYSIHLEQIGINPSSYNSLSPIIIEENSAVWITPLDWNDIDNNAILIEYDSGNDGTIESNEMINTYNITFLPPITTMDQFNLTDGSTLSIKFTGRNSSTNEFIYDDTVNVTITNSTGHLITYFTYGTGTDSVRINSEEEQYIANFHTKDYAINIGETYLVTVTFGEPDSLRGYDITYFTLIEGGKAKGN